MKGWWKWFEKVRGVWGSGRAESECACGAGRFAFGIFVSGDSSTVTEWLSPCRNYISTFSTFSTFFTLENIHSWHQLQQRAVNF
jgi:hypothetical protein